TFVSSTHFDLSAGKWTKLIKEYVVPPGTTNLAAWIINSSAKPISLSDAHLRLGGPKKAGPRIPKQPKDKTTASRKRLETLDGPGIIRAEAQAAVASRTDDAVGVLTFPIPGTYRDQIPLTFDLQVDPPAALKSYRWVRRSDQRNW